MAGKMRCADLDYSLAGAAALEQAHIDEHLYGVYTRGYSVVPDFLEPRLCRLLRQRLTAALDTYVPRHNERSVLERHLLHDLLCRDIAFGRLLEDPRLQQLVAPLLGEHWIMYAFTSSSLPPRESNYGRRLHIDSPRFAPGYNFNIGLIWALDAFSVDNGGTEVLPGSHHSAATPQPHYFERNLAQITCAPGSLILFHARLFHRSGFNRGDDWRHALTMNCCRSFMKQRMDWVRFVPVGIADRLNPQARRLIGYDTRLPASLDELFLPDEQRLYKPNQG
ncbi:MAG TPA: phytanoyl-CoA dioxygenase family protein [Burkholderiales bacterium]|nr:phytanoyl-CoA dioxygenase family protein [Burkholderiales bacterium]